MQTTLGRVVPKTVKERFIYPFLDRRKAAMLARTSKRVDICSAQFAHVLHLAGGFSLEGKTCLEIGSGWVLSHALVFYLLGAKRIIATDLHRIFYPPALTFAVKESIESIPRDLLAPFADYSTVRDRFDRLRSIKNFTGKDLNDLGIEYISPVDIAAKPLGTPVDFVFSLSVLEHVPKACIRSLLENLMRDLKANGVMLHCVHLSDHQDFEAPFDFLGVPAANYPLKSETYRGNRVRVTEWTEIFNSLRDAENRMLYSYVRNGPSLPAKIDSSIRYTDERDLRTTNIGVLTHKIASGTI